MPRQSDNILDTLTTLPWWVSVLVATIVYVAMAFILPQVGGDNILAAGIGQASVKLAPYGFFLFLLPVPVSMFHASRKRKQLDSQQSIDSIHKLSWQQFEELVGEAYRRQGFRVVENDGAGPDGGVDLVISKEGKRFLVQCKQYRSQKVGVKVVREMFGLVSAEQAAGGVIICSGQFTRDAIQFAQNKSLQLVGGEQLLQLVSAVQSDPKIVLTPVTSKKFNQAVIVPVCPVCNSTMVLRTARKGKNTGQQFWGCSGFPKCRGTRHHSG